MPRKGYNMLPKYWIDFIKKYNLIGSYIEIPEEIDLSELGTEMEIMTEKMCLEEAEDAYPGLIVIKDGYVPIGSCQIGSGDPYFINKNDGENGPLYRIYHDSVFEDGYNKDEAIDKVLDNYSKILNYIQA